MWWGVLVVCLVGDGDGSEQAGDVLDRSTDFSNFSSVLEDTDFDPSELEQELYQSL